MMFLQLSLTVLEIHKEILENDVVLTSRLLWKRKQLQVVIA